MPAIFSVDPRVTKTINVPGGVALQLIAEAFDVLNDSNVNLERNTYYGFASGQLVPQTNPLTGFGSPAGSAGPRIVQLAAKVSF